MKANYSQHLSQGSNSQITSPFIKDPKFANSPQLSIKKSLDSAVDKKTLEGSPRTQIKLIYA